MVIAHAARRRPRFIPLEIGADYVLGRSRDADDALHAVMYRLEKPR